MDNEEGRLIQREGNGYEKWRTEIKRFIAQIGKELLQPKLPLCLRLIGLRVTKLKDLRVPDEKGIKRVRNPRKMVKYLRLCTSNSFSRVRLADPISHLLKSGGWIHPLLMKFMKLPS